MTTIGAFFQPGRQLGIAFRTIFDHLLIPSTTNYRHPILLYPDIFYYQYPAGSAKGYELALWMGAKIIGRQDEQEITGKVHQQGEQAILPESLALKVSQNKHINDQRYNK